MHKSLQNELPKNFTHFCLSLALSLCPHWPGHPLSPKLARAPFLSVSLPKTGPKLPLSRSLSSKPGPSSLSLALSPEAGLSFSLSLDLSTRIQGPISHPISRSISMKDP
ncbi:hypothetical protein AMTRI_Chr10g4690 [Amborella trichopoda]